MTPKTGSHVLYRAAGGRIAPGVIIEMLYGSDNDIPLARIQLFGRMFANDIVQVPEGDGAQEQHWYWDTEVEEAPQVEIPPARRTRGRAAANDESEPTE